MAQQGNIISSIYNPIIRIEAKIKFTIHKQYTTFMFIIMHIYFYFQHCTYQFKQILKTILIVHNYHSPSDCYVEIILSMLILDEFMTDDGF